MERQPAQRGGGGLGPQTACRGVELDPIAVDGDERKLDRDEEASGEDQQEYGDEAEGRVDGDRPGGAGVPRESRGQQ